MDGDIDKALKHTNAYYADVLKEHPQIHFKLRCRKFIEMMRKSQELLLLQASSPTSASASKRRRSASPGLDEHAVFDQEMELDDGGWDGDGDGDGMETEESPKMNERFNELLTEAVEYGQQLRLDYHQSGDDGLDLKMLDEVFSLVCYPDPKGSPHGHYLDPEGRVAVAEELNSAILGMFTLFFLLDVTEFIFRAMLFPGGSLSSLFTQLIHFKPVSLGKNSEAALERLYQQTEVLVNEISEGGAGAFINVRNDLLL